VNVVVAFAAMALSAVAAACVLAPLRRASTSPIEEEDPLEQERGTVVRDLRDLEEDHARGILDERDYRALRKDAEARAVAVLRAIDARDEVDELAVGLRELRREGKDAAQAEAAATGAGRRSPLLPGLLVAASVIAVAVPVLAHALAPREDGQPVTGSLPAPRSLAFYEQRVQDHPHDVAARLDLAARYMAAGDDAAASDQYLAALRLDPRNAEAQASLGFLLYRAGRPRDGLRAERRALRTDPSYPEALYYEGVILFRGLHRRDQAAAPLQAYLSAAPFGSHRADVRGMLRRISGP
jgi:cytochrome c-type biogenesis protein CcmH/NrfG